MQNIWQTLSKPIFILAPMEDVTDTVFRQVILTTGKPDLYFTEFTNVDGMFSKGEYVVKQRLLFTLPEKPIIAQIWGLKPENFYKAAKLLEEMEFDGIDINMGCPERSVTSKGACSALINNHSLAKEIIEATVEGAGKLPVSLKTRIGFKEIQTEEWIGFLLKFNLAALTIHGRTASEMSAVPCHWNEIGKVVKMRNVLYQKDSEQTVAPLIIGNGDVQSLQEAKEKVEKYHVDGVMIGKGIFHNPWLFNENIHIQNISLKQRLELLLYHVSLYEKTWQGKKPFPMLKKYFKMYLSGFDGAHELRMEFMETKTLDEAKILAEKFLLNI